jgi:hypothetical protein
VRRFVAALAVLFFANPVWAAGWYLMIPPLRHGPAFHATSFAALSAAVDSTAPFDEWETIFSYDSAGACDGGRMGFRAEVLKTAQGAIDKALKNFASLSLQERSQLWIEKQSVYALCISSDDPRLLALGHEKQWRLIGPPMIEKFQKPPKYVDDLLDKTAPPKAQEVIRSYPSEWACEEAKETLLMGFLDLLHLEDVDRNQLDLTHLDMKSKQHRTSLVT